MLVFDKHDIDYDYGGDYGYGDDDDDDDGGGDDDDDDDSFGRFHALCRFSFQNIFYSWCSESFCENVVNGGIFTALQLDAFFPLILEARKHHASWADFDYFDSLSKSLF